jgi:tetratricopeptide (TPR) repeat protein
MSFRSDFFDEIRPMNLASHLSPQESILVHTIDRGLTAQHREMSLIRQKIVSGLSEAADRYREASDDASQTIADEIAYQAEQDRRVALEISSEINWNIEQARVFLGAQITEVRWAVERNTEVTQSVLDSLWKTHWIDSRQFFDEGVQCYESAEREFARERFQKASEACRTNGFAYQYLGFLAVHDDDQTQALRCFELAAKFAPDNHHQAIARYHLARAWHAAGNELSSLDQIRLAVELAPTDLAYQFELIRALMRTGHTQEAIRELQKLILVDLKYWTAAAIDRSLDPLRAEINGLLGKMREEERVTANNLLGEFLETIRAVESFPEPLPLVFISANEWRKSMESKFDMGTIFAYREVVVAVSASHRTFIEMAIGRYKEWISAEQRKLASLENGNLTDVAAIRAQIPSLIGQADGVKSGLSLQEAQVKNEYRSKENGYGCALGCTGCLEVLGLMIWAGILIEYFGIKGRNGLPDTLGKLMIYAPLVLILPLMVVGRWIVFREKRNSLRRASNAEVLEIESRAEAAERAARETEKKGIEKLKSSRVEFDRLRSIYRNNIALLEKRLAIATTVARQNFIGF